MTSSAGMEGLDKRMRGALHVLREELAGLRTGRPAPGMLDRVSVGAYGTSMPLSQLATVSVADSRTLSVQVWDESLAESVGRAITAANLGLNPQREGAVIRINVPPLTEERRKEMVKAAQAFSEQARIAIRNVRRDGVEQVRRQEKESALGSDDARSASDAIQKRTDHFIAEVDRIVKAREEDILRV